MLLVVPCPGLMKVIWGTRVMALRLSDLFQDGALSTTVPVRLGSTPTCCSSHPLCLPSVTAPASVCCSVEPTGESVSKREINSPPAEDRGQGNVLPAPTTPSYGSAPFGLSQAL